MPDELDKRFYGEMTRLMHTVIQKVDGLAVDVTALKDDFGLMKQDLGSLKDDFGAMKQEVGSLKEDVGIMKQEVNSLKENVGLIKQEVGSITKEVSTIKGDLDIIKEVVRHNTKSIVILTDNVKLLTGRFEDVAGVVIKDTQRIGSLEHRVDILESEVH